MSGTLRSPGTPRLRRSWLQIDLDVPEETAEEMAAFLVELTDSGVECGASGKGRGKPGTERIICYLPEDEHRPAREESLYEFIDSVQDRYPGQTPVVAETGIIGEEDWGQSWKEHFTATRITSRLTVTPSWVSYSPSDGEVVIEIDPGMAFGTGLHASTGLCLELIERESGLLPDPPAEVLDIGTGTGILGMACAKMGSRNVTAIDNDPDAVAVAIENVRRNGLTRCMAVMGVDLARLKGGYDLIAANITSDVLMEMAPSMAGLLNPGGALVLAGILKGEQEEGIRRTCIELGLVLGELRFREEWAAVSFRRPAFQEGQ